MTFPVASISLSLQKDEEPDWDMPTHRAGRPCSVAPYCGHSMSREEWGECFAQESSYLQWLPVLRLLSFPALLKQKWLQPEPLLWKTAAGFVYLFRICLARSRFTERMILVGNGSMLALLNAVHANHTPACINLMLLKVDAGCLAVAWTKTALVALFRIYCDAEKRITWKEAQDRSYRANRITIGSSVASGQNNKHSQSSGSNNKSRQALQPYIRFIKGITVCPFSQISKQIVAPLPYRLKRLLAIRPYAL